VNRRDTTPYLIKALLGCALALQGAPSPAQDQAPDKTPPAVSAQVAPQADRTPSEYWVLTLSPYTYHWSYDPQHAHVILAALERHRADESFAGLSLFRNSFGQPSAYAFYGWRWNNIVPHNPALYAKLSLGVIYGYLPPYEDKVPLNYHGFSPGIIPALGYRLNRNDALQINILGNAGLTFSYERSF